MATMIRLDFPVLLNLVEPVPYRVFIIPDAYTFVKIYSQENVTIHGLCVRELTHFVRYGPDAV